MLFGNVSELVKSKCFIDNSQWTETHKSSKQLQKRSYENKTSCCAYVRFATKPGIREIFKNH